MPSRTYWMPALVLWFASMSWLISSKVLPTFTGGQPPGYGDLLPKTEVVDPAPVRWLIRWNGEEIGRAENRITRNTDGTGRIVSEVKFLELPVDQMLRDLLGVLGQLAGSLTQDIGEIDLHVLTTLYFDHYGTMSRIESKIAVADIEDMLRVEGRINDDKLDLQARFKAGGDTSKEMFKREFHLPPDALLTDSFSPRPKMANLRVGQTWTFQSYQPLTPHNPLTLIQAKVEREELLEWNGKMVQTRRVAFRRDAGSGISSTRKPISESWVTRDGTVLRQDIMLASVKIQFVRLDDSESQDPPTEDTSSLQEPADE